MNGGGPPVRSREQSLAWTVTLVLGVLILIPSMLGFVMKFLEFAKLARQTSGGAGPAGEGGFAVTPIVNYVCASAGFLLLLLWAAVNGMFRDLEHPKYAMLLNEKELDADV
jgi:hypothetical protein